VVRSIAVVEGERISTTRVGGPSIPRELMAGSRRVSRYTRSGWTMLVSLRITSIGEYRIFPRRRLVT